MTRAHLSLVVALCPILVAVIEPGAARAQTDRAGQAVPVEGEPFLARLLGIDPQWQVAVQSGEGRRDIDAADLVRWGSYRDRASGPQIILADGGVLLADVLSVTGQYVGVESNLWSATRIPLPMVRGILFHPPPEDLQRDKLIFRILSAAGDADQLWLENGDVVSGVVRVTPAVVGGEVPSKISFETQGRELSLEMASLTALVFNPALVSPPKPTERAAWLGFRDGSLILADAVAATDKSLRVVLPGEVKLETHPDFTPETMWNEITLIRTNPPRVSYLSDMRPIGYKHVPFLESPWPYQQDRSVLGGRLRAGGAVFTNGLGMHSTSRLAYELGGAYRRFEAELAIDQSAGRRGSVEFRVFTIDADGKVNPVYTSPTVRGGDAPLRLSIDVTGRQRLALIVGFAERGDEWDHANWLNARLVK